MSDSFIFENEIVILFEGVALISILLFFTGLNHNKISDYFKLNRYL